MEEPHKVRVMKGVSTGEGGEGAGRAVRDDEEVVSLAAAWRMA